MPYPVRPVIIPSALYGQANGQLTHGLVPTAGQAGGPTVVLIGVAARSWRALAGSAAAAGHILKATSVADSYRPYSVQEATFRARYTLAPLIGRPTRQWQGRTWWQMPGTATAAVPGTSNHGLGLAVDIASVDPHVAWLVANEQRFGFSHELQDEPWHVRYFTGDTIPAATLEWEKREGTVKAFKYQGGYWVSTGDVRRPIADATEWGCVIDAYPGCQYKQADSAGFPTPDLASVGWNDTYIDLVFGPVAQAVTVELSDAQLATLAADIASQLDVGDSLTESQVRAAVKQALREGTGS